MSKKIYSLWNKFPLIRIFKYLNEKHKLRIKIFIGISLLLSLFEIFILSSLYPLVLTFLNASEVEKDTKTYPALFSNLDTSNILIIFLFVVIFSSIIKIWLVWFNGKTSALIGSHINTKIFQNSLFANYEDFLTTNSSETIANLTSISESGFKSLFINLQLVSSLLNIIGIFSGLLVINSYVAITLLVFFGTSYFFIGKFSRKRLFKNGQIIDSKNKVKIKYTQEGLGSIRDIILDNSQSYYLQSFKKVDYAIRNLSAKNLFYTVIPKYLIESIIMILIGICFLFLRFSGSELNNNFLAVISVFLLGAQRLLPSLQISYSSWAQIKSYQNALEIITSELNKLKFKELEIYKKEKLKIDHIKLQNISYKYPTAKDFSLKNISFELKAGDHLGITGRTGSGKSTLVDILLGLLKPSKGSILINDKDLYNIKNSNKFINRWRNSIAHIPQNIFILDDSIASNIAFGEFNSFDYEKIKYYASLANISEFIETLPDKYETKLGERGARLSGGQIQRIAIARALYKSCQIIVMDEATSSLDNETEQKVLETIDSLIPKVTLITIAHRLTAVKNCNKIINLKDGTIEKYSQKTR